MKLFAYHNGTCPIRDDQIDPSLGSTLRLALAMGDAQIDDSATERDCIRTLLQTTNLALCILSRRIEDTVQRILGFLELLGAETISWTILRSDDVSEG